jgi:putative membrane protein
MLFASVKLMLVLLPDNFKALAIITAIVIAILGYLIELALGERISPRSRGIVGFVVSVIVIYAAQYIIPNYLSVTILGALLAAFVIGLIDAFVPTELR